MENLILDATPNTPKVLFNPADRVFEIAGESRPENVKDFYGPILKWLDDYLAELTAQGKKDAILLKMYIEYFNSSSAKYILNIAKKMHDFVSVDIPVTIDWCYIEDDEDMKETGEEMERMSKVPFNYLVVE
ncbi:MAG: DUF1987 domain-containing protein [Bacteroidia bacterium]|nr:DUF1987 domain-containing protein [Bacteroidia bacterium]